MPEARIDDESVLDVLYRVLNALDEVQATQERQETLLEDISEKVDNINLGGDGFSIEG